MVISVRTQDAMMLPIRDVKMASPQSSSAEVGVQPGPVFFSGAAESVPIGIDQLYGGSSAFAAFKR